MPLARCREGRARHLRCIVLLAASSVGCAPPSDAAHGVARPGRLVTTSSNVHSIDTRVLRVALNQHLRTVMARSSVALDPGAIGDAAPVLFTEPTAVVYDDPRDAGLAFALGTGRFVALDQAAGWVYGIHVTPQRQAAPITAAVAAARDIARALAHTAWRRDATAPWRADDDTIRTWVSGADEELPVARFTAGSAAVEITLAHTGPPTPSERLRGRTAEAFYVNVSATDLSHLGAYGARVLRARRAHGNGTVPVPLATFMDDTTPP